MAVDKILITLCFVIIFLLKNYFFIYWPGYYIYIVTERLGRLRDSP